MTSPPSLIARKSPSRSGRSLTARVFLVLLTGYCILPFYWLIVSSTKSGPALFSSFALWFSHPGSLITNVREVFAYNNGIFLTWLRNTTFYALTSACGATVVCLMAGYAFAKFQFAGKNALFAAVLTTLLVPTTALAIPLYILLSRIGLVNTPWAFILPSIVNPLGVYLMRVYAEASVPTEVLEAARVDGANEWRIMLTIATPLLVPSVVTVFLLSTVMTWNNYFLPLVVLNNENLFPLTVGLAAWNSQATAGGGAQVLFPLVITGSLLAIAPLIALFIFLQRFWQTGLAAGAVK